MKKSSYKNAGVDIDEGMRAVGMIKDRLKQVAQMNVLSGIGGFGGIFDISELGFKKPVIVSSIDGVGTKTKVAAAWGKCEGIGRDIVSHCINDIAVQGARPLFFMDYIGVSKLQAELVDQLVSGIVSVCEEENCTLLGGETAEMPGVYSENEFDLVGCIVGAMEKDDIITGQNIKEGDVIIGLSSSGLHTNGYSLARNVLLDSGAFKLSDIPDGLSQPLGDELLIPHRCYGKIILKLCRQFTIKGMAHITGGGLIENVPRILPDSVDAVFDSSSWPVLSVFDFIQRTGNIDREEMYRVFNMGIGITFVVRKADIDAICQVIANDGWKPYVIGSLQAGSRKVIIR